MSEGSALKETAQEKAREHVRKLAESESQVAVDISMKPIRYINSGKEMYRMGNIYYSEGDYQRAFTLFMRFVTLFLEKLPRHPAYATVSEVDRALIKRLMREVMDKAGDAKSKLIAEFSALYETRLIEFERAEAKRRAEEEEERQKAEAAHRQAAAEQQRRATVVEAQAAPAKPKTDWSAAASSNFNFSTFDFASQLPKMDDKSALRNVIISSLLPLEFLKVASSNTKQNRETCGVLCGKLVHNEFRVTHVVVPKQHGTSDTCDTLEEHEIFAVLEQHDLITLGWIHTHPSQTAFLSSVDLHTHYGYQCLLPEALAIVCSPRYNEIGYFSLTASSGMPTLASCRQPGFHEHKNSKAQPLFETAAFVRLTKDSDFRFVDLR